MYKKNNNKIMSRSKLAEVLKKLKRKGKTIGLTNGVFDIIHSGHVSYLEEAKKLCDVLVVSLNTDASVRKYKSPARPLVPLKERQLVTAALESVDFVTNHGERRMKKTLEALKPDLYIKGGDYDVSQLTSRKTIESQGGRTIVLPLKKGISTTGIIRKAHRAASLEGLFLDNESKKMPAAFLDRDGVIIKALPYMHEPEKVKLTVNAVEGLKKLQESGFRLIIITNQPGIGLGYFSKEDFFLVNSRMLYLLSAAGILIDAVYFCPHSSAAKCSCRKPKTGLLKKALAEQAIIRKGSCFFGDREVDIKTARSFRIPGILVGSGDSQKAKDFATAVGKDLLAAVTNYLKISSLP